MSLVWYEYRIVLSLWVSHTFYSTLIQYTATTHVPVPVLSLTTRSVGRLSDADCHGGIHINTPELHPFAAWQAARCRWTISKCKWGRGRCTVYLLSFHTFFSVYPYAYPLAWRNCPGPAPRGHKRGHAQQGRPLLLGRWLPVMDRCIWLVRCGHWSNHTPYLHANSLSIDLWRTWGKVTSQLH